MTPYGDMVQNYYRNLAKKAVKARSERLNRITDAQEAAEEVKLAKARLQKAFGKFPERCPLDPVVTGTVTRDGITCEKVIIQVRPGMHATMSVFRKEGTPADEKQPLVLQLCGHNANGKAAGNGQRLLFTLAKAGFTTASIDPLGQGERYQYALDTDNPVRQHNLAGKLLQLEGEFFCTWRLFDARCALDYLLSRSDVDTSRVGVCGTSGGGTLSSYLFALDERIHAAAPACFITTYMRNFNNELPTDVEQIPPGLWGDGGDMADFVIARAPAPALILDVENDFFDVRGTAESFEEAKKIYSLLGKEGQGFQVAMSALDGARISISAVSTGLAHHAMELAGIYANERIAFKQPISAFEGIQFKFADMSARIRAMELMIYDAARMKDQKIPNSLEAAQTKLLCSTWATQIALEAMQIMGANGCSREYHVERFVRDAKMIEVAEGTTEILKISIGRGVLSRKK